MQQGMMAFWDGSGVSWTACKQSAPRSLHTDNHTNTSSFNFYRTDAIPDAQPTVSKHWLAVLNNKFIVLFITYNFRHTRPPSVPYHGQLGKSVLAFGHQFDSLHLFQRRLTASPSNQTRLCRQTRSSHSTVKHITHTHTHTHIPV